MTWIPGYTKIDLGPDGGVYDETAHPKGELHTTEGTTLKGAEASYKNYPPHIGYDPITRTRHQYIALNRFSYANKGNESDDEFIIQIEIIGYASHTHLWSDYIYRNIAEDVIKPLEELVGIPRISLPFHGADEGIIPYIASPSSPIRLSDTQLRNYSGWLGHQHIPRPDAHWDPGRFLIYKCFNHLQTLDPPIVTTYLEEEDEMVTWLVKGDSTQRDENNIPYGYRVFLVESSYRGTRRRWIEHGWELQGLKARGLTVLQLSQAEVDVIPYEYPDKSDS